MAGITVVGGVSRAFWQTYLTNQVGQNVMRDLRDRLYRHLQRQPLSFFTDTRTGEIQSRVSNDVGGVQTVVTNTVSNTIANSVIFLSTLAAMFVLSWQLTLVAVGTVPVFAFLTGYVGRRRRKVTAQAQEVHGRDVGHYPGNPFGVGNYPVQALWAAGPGDTEIQPGE